MFYALIFWMTHWKRRDNQECLRGPSAPQVLAGSLCPSLRRRQEQRVSVCCWAFALSQCSPCSSSEPVLFLVFLFLVIGQHSRVEHPRGAACHGVVVFTCLLWDWLLEGFVHFLDSLVPVSESCGERTEVSTLFFLLFSASGSLFFIIGSIHPFHPINFLPLCTWGRPLFPGFYFFSLSWVHLFSLAINFWFGSIEGSGLRGWLLVMPVSWSLSTWSQSLSLSHFSSSLFSVWLLRC